MTAKPANLPPPHKIQDRFKPSRQVVLTDRFMNHFIKIGGIGLISAVLGIFIFIFWQILPLFGEAQVTPLKTYELPKLDPQIMGMDEWGEMPFMVTGEGHFYFVNLAENGKLTKQNLLPDPGAKVSAIGYSPETNNLVVGTADGRFALVTIVYQPSYENDQRTILGTTEALPLFNMLSDDGKTQGAIRDISYGTNQSQHLVGSIVETEGRRQVHLASLLQTNSLLGAGEITIGKKFVLQDLPGTPQFIRINALADTILISTMDGSIHYYNYDGNTPQLKQSFKPFENRKLFSMNFLLGGVSVYLTDDKGNNALYSIYLTAGGADRLFGPTKTPDNLPGSLQSLAIGLQNKSYVVATAQQVDLRHATTGKSRWKMEFPHPISQVALAKKYHRLAVLDEAGKLHLYAINDPHPEGGWKSFFGKIWYEGGNSPEYVWQSTGGTDSFESKLSLVPLIIGTLKGTFYAMIFAFPIAILAALYAAEFLHPKFKTYVKPVMELMASLPSVILGFLAALWLSPLIEDKVPSLLMIIIILPLTSLLVGSVWARLPTTCRIWLPQGYESWLLIPVLCMATVVAWNLGPVVEGWWCVVTDPVSGNRVADFRLWWPQVTGIPFEQRNSLVVGFIMGFAVIPLIFTISEDALSAVPKSLRSASLACGASRWQTAFRVVLPTAAAGIFSATMIGLGRAVGETMIVLMATGNTPIMDFNIFSGMRTLSANLAVELPEAPFQGTLYRTLFLGALVLFIMTFMVNTVAELMRQYLRKKYQTL